jgi:hypothetical protein
MKKKQHERKQVQQIFENLLKSRKFHEKITTLQ